MSLRRENELTCKPLDTYNEVLMFLQDPPPWRTLCKDIQTHSTRKLKNIDINSHDGVVRTLLDGAEAFCHFDPDADDPKRHDEKQLPKTLVCHDMANGYHDDCIIDGTGKHDAYTFYNWAGIDIFCYFSHHLITIPPLGWINVAHEHGVKVIGTVITEWADGIEFWKQVLESEEDYKNFASALVAIAKTLKFDGWLLNVENKIDQPSELLSFVEHLHTILHQELTDPVLIWYDSVTSNGHLNWQNALNDKNRMFFDACDGFFTNYSWTVGDIESSAAEAGARLHDLFIGIDVWGRNFYGGGQFNCQEAIEVAHRHGCSLAIFAPAWTYEAIATDESDVDLIASSERLDRYDHFLLRDRALWNSMWRYLNTKLPSELPFKTSFCKGQGLKRRLYGEVICPVPWYNLRHMQYQPNSSHGPHGYLLSTVENILNASRTRLLKDPNGIIKYRKEYQSHDVMKIEDKTDNVVDFSNNVSQNITPKESVEAVTPVETDSETVSTDVEPKKTSKRKIKDVLKNIFHKSKSKKEEVRHIKLEDNDERPDSEVITKLEGILEQGPDQKFDMIKPSSAKSTSSGIKFKNVDSTIKFEVENNTLDHESEQKAAIDKVEQEEVTSVSSKDVATVDEETIARNKLSGPSMVQMSVNVILKDKIPKTRYGLASVPDELECLEVYYEDSFIGGSCLKLNPSDEHSTDDDNRHIRLFHCDFECEESLIFCVVTKTLIAFEEQFLNVKVHTTNSNGDSSHFDLIGRDVAQAVHRTNSAGFIINVAPVNVVSGKEFRELQKYMLLNEPGFYVPIENSYGWIVRYYEVNMPGARVTSINCNLGLSHGPLLLGYIGVCRKTTRHDED